MKFKVSILALTSLLAVPSLLAKDKNPPAAPLVAPVSAAPKAEPVLTHEEKVKLFAYEDEKREVFNKFQKQFEEAIKPISETEAAYIKIINEAHPGWELRNDPTAGWKFVEKPAETPVPPDSRK